MIMRARVNRVPHPLSLSLHTEYLLPSPHSCQGLPLIVAAAGAHNRNAIDTLSRVAEDPGLKKQVRTEQCGVFR